MRLTTYEILEANNGLPALVQALLQAGEVKRALELGKMVHKLRPEVEVFNLNQNALIQAYGEEDPKSRQKVVKAGTEGHEQYQAAYRELLGQEHPLNVDPFPVSSEEIELLATNPQAVIAIQAVIILQEETE